MRNRSVPSAVVIPVLAYPDVPLAADWLCRAFGLTERVRIGAHRAQLTFGAGAVILTELQGEGVDLGRGHSVHVAVPDLDAHHERSVAAGAQILHPPTTYPFGERQYTAADLAGHRWTFSQSVADIDPVSWGAKMAEPLE